MPDKKTSQPIRVPPHDDIAEKSVLGSMLIDAGAITTVAEILQPKHFYFDEHRNIYSAILSLFDKSKPIDIVTLTAQLQEDGSLKKIGGSSYLADLIEAVPTSAYVKHYAEIVKNMYIKRSLITVGSNLVGESFDQTGDVQEILNKAETDIFALSQAFLHRDFLELKEILAESFERLENFMKSGAGIRGVPTGFTGLDKKLSGLQDSNLIILAARPGVGKTTMALNIALHVATKEKMPVGMFSLEMSKEELVDRLLVGQADIDAWKLKTGRLSDDDYMKLTQAMGDLSSAPIFIDDTPGASIIEMRTKARKLTIEKGLKMIIVDYLQLASPGRRMEGRVQEVSFISQSLKNIARELKIPVLALSQLSRAVEHRGEKKPQLADLRESGSIEQDADVVMFLYNLDDSDELLDGSKKIIKLSIAKHRNGPTGEIDLMFRGDRVKFYSVDS